MIASITIAINAKSNFVSLHTPFVPFSMIITDQMSLPSYPNAIQSNTPAVLMTVLILPAVSRAQ